MMTKYGFDLSIEKEVNRLTNHLWKLIPMRENEENYLLQLETVINEIVGLNEILNCSNDYLILLAKLEGLLHSESSFDFYRKTVFECISLVRGVLKNE